MMDEMLCECMGCKKHEGRCRFVDGRDGVVLTSHVPHATGSIHFLACQGCRAARGDDLQEVNAAIASLKRQQLIRLGQMDMFERNEMETG